VRAGGFALPRIGERAGERLGVTPLSPRGRGVGGEGGAAYVPCMALVRAPFPLSPALSREGRGGGYARGGGWVRSGDAGAWGLSRFASEQGRMRASVMTPLSPRGRGAGGEGAAAYAGRLALVRAPFPLSPALSREGRGGRCARGGGWVRSGDVGARGLSRLASEQGRMRASVMTPLSPRGRGVGGEGGAAYVLCMAIVRAPFPLSPALSREGRGGRYARGGGWVRLGVAGAGARGLSCLSSGEGRAPLAPRLAVPFERQGHT